MTTINDGGPAFPQHPDTPNGLSGEEYGLNKGRPGMSLRDWFAGMAIQGELAAQDYAEDSQFIWQPDEIHVLAENCYEIADAMLLAREAK